MKRLRRILSVFLVVLMLFAGYVVTPATALANGNGHMQQEEDTEGMLPVVPAEDGQDVPPPTESADEEPEQQTVQEEPVATPDAEAPEESSDTEPVQDETLTLEQGGLAEERVSVFTSARQPLEAITMEEFEELLALQPALTAEDMEAYLIRTEDEDGSGTVELYLSPVRYQTASGAWRMIDPEISVSTANGKQTLASADAPVRIDFLTKVSEDRLVTLSRDGYELSLVPVPQTGLLRMEAYDVRYLTGTATATRASGDTSASRTSYDGLRYEDVFGNGIDLVLTPTGTGLKEDIIFPSVPGQNSFSFLLDADGLTPVLREDGNAYLLDGDTSEIVAALPSPVMYDSSNVDCNFSYEIGVTIEQLPDGRYLYTLTPDRDWLTSSDRVYPVTLDPTVTYSGASYIADTHVTDQASGRKNYHTETGLKMGCMSNGDRLRVYFDFTSLITAIGTNKQITGATLTCYEEYVGNSAPSVRLHQVTSNFSISTVTWNTQPSFSSTHFSSTVVKNVGSYSWDMTAKVQEWYGNSSVLRKIVMKIPNEHEARYKRFTSTEGTTTANRPKLVVTYNSAPNAPTKPSISWAKSGTKANVTVSWSAVSGATGYDVQLYRAGTLVQTVSRTSTSYTFSNQNDNTTYYAKVRAKNSVGNSSYAQSSTITVSDLTPPAAPSSVTVSPTTWTNGNITVTHTAVSDASAVTYQYALSTSNTTAPTSFSNLPSPSALTHTLTQPTVGTRYVWVRAKDAAGNVGPAKCSSTPYKRDTTAPTITGPTVAADAGGIVQVRATITTNAADFAGWELAYHLGTGTSTEKTTIATGTDAIIARWNVTELANEQTYTLTLTAWDQAGNTASQTATWTKAEGSREIDAALSQSVQVDGEANAWSAAYEKADAADTATYGGAKLVVDNVVRDTQTADDPALTFPLPQSFAEGSTHYLYVVAFDEAGNPAYSYPTYEKQHLFLPADEEDALTLDGVTVTAGVASLTGESGTLITPALELSGTLSFIDLMVNQQVPAGATVSYEVSVDNGAWQSITPVSTDGGVTATQTNRLYLYGGDTGSSLRIRVTMDRGTATASPTVDQIYAEARYIFYGSSELIQTAFSTDARGFTELNNTEILADGGLTLSDAAETGTVQSTRRLLAGEAAATRLIVDASVPDGAAITYAMSTNGGATWQAVPTVAADDQSTWNGVAQRGEEIVLRATLTANADGEKPVLNSWSLEVRAAMPGQAQTVALIDPPDNLSAFAGANNLTVLRWAPSETEGVTYNVYRSETPYFTLSDSALVASGLTDCNWSDFNLNYGKTFYYLVAAVKDGRVSEPTNQAVGTVVTEGELEKQLGLQDYWSYARFTTDSGAGYVNVANGNVVYQTSDLVVADPFFAMAMRRTFNSQTTSKTALGVGWDFSFNTVLMREYDATGAEVGLILKDGDGSLHRFALQEDGSYDSAPGTRMALAYVAGTEDAPAEYTITRKDNVTYHFDAQTMRLKSFTNLAGAVLTLSYDARGNVVEVANSVGDKLTLAYKVQRTGAQTRSGGTGAVSYEEVLPNEADYLYVNEHIDMLESFTWTSTEGDQPSITFTYAYDAQDRLVSSSHALSGNSAYTETFTYSEAGLSSIRNPDNRVYTLTYDDAGRLTGLSYPGGQESAGFVYGTNTTAVQTKIGTDAAYTVATYTYTPATGVVTGCEDADGHAVNYTYTADLLLSSVSYTNLVEGVLNETPVVQSYTYDATTRDLTRVAVTQGETLLGETLYQNYQYNQPKTVKVKNGSGYQTTTYTYNAAGQVLTAVDPEGKTTTNAYNDYGYLIATTDRNGGYMSYAYDAKGRVITISSANGAGQTPFSVVRYTYDDYGRTATAATDGMDDTVTYEYDWRGLLTKKTYGNGAYEAYTYTTAGLTLTARDVEGVVTTYTYDDMGRVSTARVGAGSGALTTAYAYLGGDGNGVRRVTVTDPEGRATTTWYDENGRAVRQSGGGVTVAYRYDYMGNQTVVETLGGTAGNRVVRAEYDALGNQTLTAAVAAANRTKLGSHGERLSGYDVTADLTTSSAYDMLGNNTSVTDGRGTTTTYTYDALSRLTGVSQPLSTGVTATTAYAYDQSVTGGVANTVTSANGVTTTSVFDRSGRKLRDVVTDPDDATESVTTSYAYDAHGQVTSVTREDGSVVRYAYDAVGNVVSERYFASATAATPEIAITYAYTDGGGRLESAEQVTGSGETQQSVTTSYSYDEYGRVTQQRQETEAEAGALTVNYRYNGAGQVTSVSYAKESAQGAVDPGNTELHILWYTYDEDGRLSAIYLDEGTASTTSPTNNKKLIRSYAYNAYGEIEKLTDNTSFLTGGTLTTELAYTYNDFGLPVKLTYTDVDGETRTVREETNLTYDGNGNILTEAVTEAYSGSTTKTRTYQYDLGNRLISAAYDGTTTAYTYDAVGNRLTRQEGTETAETYTYNYLNQLTRVQQGTAVTTYTYDARGNQTQQVQTGTGVTTTTNYGYDLANRLTSTNISNNAVIPLSTSATYAYNAQGQRVTRVEDEVITHFYYTGSALLFTTVNEYVLQTQNILDPSGTIVASRRFEGQATTGQDPYAEDYFFYRYDIRGSVTTIVDGEGAVVKSYDYDEFGVTTSTGDAFFNEVTFTGSVADASGLLYMNARYYNPATARFLSQDSYTGSASVPWTQHLYAYCNNNPVNLVDPTGHVAVRRTPLMTYLDNGDSGSLSPDDLRILVETALNRMLNKAKETVIAAIENMKNWVTNTDERVVLEAENYAFYKGRLVIRHSIKGQTSCAIGGIIFLNRNLDPDDPESIETVKHEYGHTVQESILGFAKYVKYIAIPSLRSRDIPYRDYYSLPWERTADLFGGAVHNEGEYTYHSGSLSEGIRYFNDAMGQGPSFINYRLWTVFPY